MQKDRITLILKDRDAVLLKLRETPEEIEKKLRRYLRELFG